MFGANTRQLCKWFKFSFRIKNSPVWTVLGATNCSVTWLSGRPNGQTRTLAPNYRPPPALLVPTQLLTKCPSSRCAVTSCRRTFLTRIRISRSYRLRSGGWYYVTWNADKGNKILFPFEWRLHLPGLGSESSMCFRTFVFLFREASCPCSATFGKAPSNPWTLSMLAAD